MISDEVRLFEYIEKSIRRLQLGQVKSEDGSWLEGIFGKAARRYEQWARHKLWELLRTCSLNYDDSFRADVRGTPRFDKLSLGQIAGCFERIPNFVDQAVLQRRFKASVNYRGFCQRMFEINDAWIDCVKHGYTNLDAAQTIMQLGNMKATIEDMRTSGPTNMRRA
jgi:hypothetical protein